MRSILAGLRQLVIPWGAAQDQPRVVIGATVPPEVLALYQSADPDAQVIAGQIFHLDDDRYHWAALVLLPSFSTGSAPGALFATGVTNQTTGGVYETRNELIDFSGLTENGAGQQSIITPSLGIFKIPGGGGPIEDTNVQIAGGLRIIGDNPELTVLGTASFPAASGVNDPVQIGSNDGNMISENQGRLTMYGDDDARTSGGVQIRVSDGSFRTALRAQTDAVLRAYRDQWPTTGSAANVRLFTGDVGSDARFALSTSSRRFKRDIRPATVPVATLAAMQPVQYRDNDDPDAPERLGLVAEEMATILPEAVDRDEHGNPFSIDYNVVTTALLSVVQQQQQQIADLTTRVATLERGNDV